MAPSAPLPFAKMTGFLSRFMVILLSSIKTVRSLLLSNLDLSVAIGCTWSFVGGQQWQHQQAGTVVYVRHVLTRRHSGQSRLDEHSYNDNNLRGEWQARDGAGWDLDPRLGPSSPLCSLCIREQHSLSSSYQQVQAPPTVGIARCG